MNKLKITKHLANKCGFDSVRYFISDFGNWIYSSDWTYTGADEWSFNQFLKLYVKEQLRAKSDCTK